MQEDYFEIYKLITQGNQNSIPQYSSPEEQGASIQRCSILEATQFEYCSETKLFG